MAKPEKPGRAQRGSVISAAHGASAGQKIRRLVVVLGDQLSMDLQPFRDFDPQQDAVWMAESAGEAGHVWSHRQRIALFLAAMRHFRVQLESRSIRVYYTELSETDSFSAGLGELLDAFLSGDAAPEEVVMTRPGEHRLQEEIGTVCSRRGVPVTVHEDTGFLCSQEFFDSWASGRKQLRMEYFYREMRRRTGVLMDGDTPAGGQWNFDASNRSSFGRTGPPPTRPPLAFPPDAITQKVLALVNARFPDHPGSLDTFRWPVNREQALLAMQDFMENGLAGFGEFQDAMWTGEPFLKHSLLSTSMNLRLLMPGEVIEAAEARYRSGHAPVESVEGFIRQVLGWREYVRGIYWRYMPDYLDRNTLNANEPLPDFYWTADTPMACMRECVQQTLDYGYAHHIQRLMVTGLFGLLWGVSPRAMHEWYLAVYVDAVEWVELPNTLGMSQFADDGVMASKPYVATGKYIDRMSNYCRGCAFDPSKKNGEKACPFTVLYWEFLLRHRELLKKNPRMSLQLRNAERLSPDEQQAALQEAGRIRRRLSGPAK